jgi:AraC-like DNA-binding protein
VGFESASAFSRLFNRIVGISPSTDLTQQQKIKVQIAKFLLTFVPGCFAKKRLGGEVQFVLGM